MTDRHHTNKTVAGKESDDTEAKSKLASKGAADGLWPDLFDTREIKAIGRIALILGAFALVLIFVALVRP